MLAIPLSALTLEQASVLSPEHLTHLSRLLFGALHAAIKLMIMLVISLQ